VSDRGEDEKRKRRVSEDEEKDISGRRERKGWKSGEEKR
jgi:hypothetical protein